MHLIWSLQGEWFYLSLFSAGPPPEDWAGCGAWPVFPSELPGPPGEEGQHGHLPPLPAQDRPQHGHRDLHWPLPLCHHEGWQHPGGEVTIWALLSDKYILIPGTMRLISSAWRRSGQRCRRRRRSTSSRWCRSWSCSWRSLLYFWCSAPNCH